MTKNTHGWVLLAIATLLTLLGILFVHSASTSESLQVYGNQHTILHNHLIGIALALCAGAVGFFTPTHYWKKYAPALYVLAVGLLVLVIIPGIGVKVNGARRWLKIASFRLQPVEVFKFAFAAYQASWLAKHQKLLPFIATTSIPALLLLAQPDLGSLLVVGAIAAALYFVSGADLKTVIKIGGIGIVGVLLLIVTSSYRLQRLSSFLSPEADPTGANFQVRQITLALGRGGLLGKGIGNSQQKYLYIPEASTDSIFAIVGEELGFVGAATILLLFIAYFIVGFLIVRAHSDNKPVFLLGTGVLVWLASQAILNLGAVVVLLPLTGIPLPFFSYGRTSQVMVWFVTGVIARMGMQK